ncbi:hypothetical protein KPH14_010286 [Odynerus spinipes]|uniref:Uncharacterized protein n=1 Tax=Odynerus spinipes TaxID=1348599 RepID=A0AAD9RU55_9HYME|nr:hypothetical protein KPH14_010286 [Odynerus spinipes]
MLVLHVVALILTLTSALHVPNLSEESTESTHGWQDHANSQGETKSAKYAAPSRVTNRKQFSSEESVKSVTPATHDYISGPRSQSLSKEHYPKAPINQNSAYGGSFSPSYQVKPYANTNHFSMPYFENFGNSKPTTQLKIIAPSQVEKLQQGNTEEGGFNQKPNLGGFTSLNHEFPFYSSNHNQKEGLSSNVQVPIYRTQYPGPKNSEYVFNYSPSHQSESSFEPALRSTEKLSQYFPQNDASVTLAATNKKVALPVTHHPNTQDISGYLRAFENQPVLLNHNLNYQPNLNFDLANHRQIAQPNNISPFQSPVSSFQGQVIPIQTASSTPQFPQYKGAAVAAYPAVSFDLRKTPRTYQPLRTQPQLHFQSVNSAPQLINPYQNTIIRSKPAEEIREDVEIIKKKPPPPPPKKDDDDFDDGYKSVEAEYGPNSNDEDDYQPGKYFKESSTEGDFKPSKSFPFKEYDEKFGKHSNKQNNRDEEEEKPYHSKYQSYSSSENDDDEDAHSSKYSTDYESSEPHRTSYNDEEEEETQKYERKGEREEDSDNKDESKRSKYFGRSFEKEFDEFYKKPLSKNKYARAKEAPEVEFGHSDYRSPKSYQKNEGRFGPYKEESEATSSTGYYVPRLANTKVQSISNEKVLRDLTGI